MNNSEDENNSLEEHNELATITSQRPTPTLRTSLTVRFSYPDDPTSKREVADITVDHLLVKETDLSIATDNILANVSHELQEIDKSISYVVTNKNPLITEHSEHTENPIQAEILEQRKDYKKTKSEQQILEERYSEIRIDWNKDQITHDHLNMANDIESQQPSNHIRANTYADLIPENSKFNIKHSFTKVLDSLIPQSILNVQIIKDLTELAHSLQELNTLEKLPSETPSKIMIGVDMIILYLLISCLIILNTFIIFKYKNNKTKMYKPDLPDTELSENK